MRDKLASWSILGGTTICVIIGLNQPSYGQSINFVCTPDTNNTPTTYAETPDGLVEVFKWTSNFFNPPYTPMQRCLEVSQRMNDFKPNHLVSGKVNSYNVICAGTSCDPGGNNILVTLNNQQNPSQVLQEIDANRHGAGGPSSMLSSSGNNENSRSSLKSNGSNSVILDLNQYISSAPKLPMAVRRNEGSETNNNSPILPSSSPSAPPNPSSVRGSVW